MQTRCHAVLQCPRVQILPADTGRVAWSLKPQGPSVGICEWMRGVCSPRRDGGRAWRRRTQWNLLFTTSLGWLRVWNIIERTWQRSLEGGQRCVGATDFQCSAAA